MDYSTSQANTNCSLDTASAVLHSPFTLEWTGYRIWSTHSFLTKWLGEEQSTTLENLELKIVYFGYLAKAFNCEDFIPVAYATRNKYLCITLPREEETTSPPAASGTLSAGTRRVKKIKEVVAE